MLGRLAIRNPQPAIRNPQSKLWLTSTRSAGIIVNLYYER